MIEAHNIRDLIEELGKKGYHVPEGTTQRVLDILTQKEDPIQLARRVFLSLRNLKRFALHGEALSEDTVHIHQLRMHNLGVFSRHLLLYQFSFLNNNFQGFSRDSFDYKYFRTYLSSHDIVEGCTPIGDIPTHIKSELSERETLDALEREMLNILKESGFIFLGHHKNSPEIFDRLQNDIINKTSIESQIGSYLDKIDGWAKAFFEVIMGNTNFIVPLSNYKSIFRESEKLKTVSNRILRDRDRFHSFFFDFTSGTLPPERTLGMLHEKEIESMNTMENFGGKGINFYWQERAQYIVELYDISQIHNLKNEENFLGICKGLTILEILVQEEIPKVFKAWLIAQFPEFYIEDRDFETGGYFYPDSRDLGRHTLGGRHVLPLSKLSIYP